VIASDFVLINGGGLLWLILELFIVVLNIEW
jgi:hypothetical protein